MKAGTKIGDWLSKWIDCIKKKRKIAFFLIVCAAFGAVFLLNHVTPLLNDDFYYAFICGTDQKLSSIKDVFLSQYNHYFIRGGRTIGHFFTQTFMLLGKPMFNIINSGVYVCLTLLMYALVRRRKPYDLPVYCLIHAGLWCFLPVWGQNVLWQTGACVYLWVLVFALFFLLFYHREWIGDGARKRLPGGLKFVLLFVLGVLAGWSSEITGLAAILMAADYSWLIKKKHGRIKAWCVSGLFGVVLGYVMMMAAPGNFKRLSSDGSKGIFSVFGALIEGFARNLYQGVLTWFLLFGLFLVLIILLKKKRKNTAGAWGFALSGVIASFILSAAAGGFSPRAILTTVVFLILACLNVLCEFEWKGGTYQKAVAAGLICIGLFIGVQYTQAVVDNHKVYAVAAGREQTIAAQKQESKRDAQVQKITARYRHNAAYRLEDITTDPQFWLNQFLERYYNMDSIAAIPAE